MARPDFLNDEYVYRVAPDGKSTQAALKLLRDSAFRDPGRSADGLRLEAGCQGSEPTPYQVQVDLSDPAYPRMSCNCMSMKAPCKHTLGLLFLAIRAPEAFVESDRAAPAGKRQRQNNTITAVARELPDAEEGPPANVGEALLQAILAEPEEDAPRLIYADWLEEHGGPVEQDRAEFIRVQIELARGTEPGPRTRKLQAREKELWKRRQSAWQKCLPPHLRKRTLPFQRGFLEELSIRPESWVKHAHKLFGQNPIYRLHLSFPMDRRRAGLLAVIPELERIRVLDFSSFPLRDAGKILQVLLATPFFSHLKRLHLRQCEITTHAIGVLAQSPSLPRLHVLDLAGNRIGPRGGEVLAALDGIAGLQELSLADNPLGDAGARALGQSPFLDGLTRLDLRGVALGKSTQAALRQRFGERLLL